MAKLDSQFEFGEIVGLLDGQAGEQTDIKNPDYLGLLEATSTLYPFITFSGDVPKTVQVQLVQNSLREVFLNQRRDKKWFLQNLTNAEKQYLKKSKDDYEVVSSISVKQDCAGMVWNVRGTKIHFKEDTLNYSDFAPYPSDYIKNIAKEATLATARFT